MNKIPILIAIVLLAGCSSMRGTDSTRYGSSGASGSSNVGTYDYSLSEYGRPTSHAHTVPYAEDPYASWPYSYVR